MIQKTSLLKGLILLVFCTLMFNSSFAQQDPQYTQYMYNTMSVNPAYAGQREVLSVTGLHRTQWVGIDGAPQTQTLGIHAPLRNDKIGLGLSIVNDALGPVNEYYIDANFSYTIQVSDNNTKLSFGAKAGMHGLTSDWSEGVIQQIGDPTFADNLSLFSPTVGAGLYLHNRKWYVGLSVPNFLKTDHFDEGQVSIAEERMNYYLIAGYVFDLSANTKLKPAALVKAVSGAPIIADLSANFLFNDKFTLGVAWRWDDSVSGLAGIQVTDGLYIGYSYDATTTNLNNYNSGSHEIMLRFELQKIGRILSPRFF
ncbi:type IX secretion system membrane protein PorP/SprF [Psychroserpens sp. AS72]|uniref:PorP/SprF family type IX secretion system membrane protein n=1 Tax=Psychroserpens sp. AS72 TaxID=3135775 RepID=UPI0031786B9E